MEKLNIYQKLVEVRKTIDFFKKDQKSFNYEYVSGVQILAKIKSKMDELGVVLEPHVKHSEGKYFIYEYTTTSYDKFKKQNVEKKNIDYIVDMPMEYIWVNAEKPEDRIICSWSLLGQQSEVSKAFGSGLTYSERYFLLKYFGIPTDDIDPDNKGNDKKPTPDKGSKPAPSKPDAKPDKALDTEIKNIDKKVTELREKKVTDKVIGDTIKETSFGKLNFTQIKDVKVAKEVLTALTGVLNNMKQGDK